jgi:hypothetical protein
MPVPIKQTLRDHDLTPRVYHTETVVASPAAAAETIIASVQVTDDVSFMAGVLVIGWAAFTVGTAGVSAQLRVRQTAVNGTLVVAGAAVTETAANLDNGTVVGFDAAPAAGQVYKLTLTVASANAASTVSAVELVAIAI